MKKYLSIIGCIVLGVVMFPLCFNYNKKDYPNEYYNVYLDDELLGTIASKDELLSYISNNAKKFVDGENIYKPIGLEIEKALTYETNINSIEEIYSKIAERKSFTVKGYQFTIDNGQTKKYIYVLDKEVFKNAVDKFIEVYVGKDEYEAYLKNTQTGIKTVGSMIENVYIQENITVKEKQIPIDYKIYTDADDLAQFLIYGESTTSKLYTVKNNEMISDIAIANEISNQEFLIANPKYKSENSLIAVGSDVVIKQTNPQLRVVVEKFVVEDKTVNYKTIYEHDETQYVGYTKTTQEGKKGLQRVSHRDKSVNGSIVYVEPKGKDMLRNTIDEIIVKGDKVKPNVGDLNNWAWPSESGWTSTDGWGYRIHPITGERKFHYGIDIAGTGYNSAVYAANNGTIIIRGWHNSFGNYIVINHNNGYYTLYGHMNKFYPGQKVGDTVLRGQQIGYVGSTGDSTGPHIHFELWKGCEYCRISPWSIY